MIGQPFEILDDGGQHELVFCAGEAAQSQARHGENILGLTKQTFDLLTFTARLGIMRPVRGFDISLFSLTL